MGVRFSISASLFKVAIFKYFREDIMALRFTVGVYGEEPNPSFISEPDDNTVDSKLDATNTCHCTPKAKGELIKPGNITDNSAVAVNITKAVKDTNDLDPQSIKVTIETVKPVKDGHLVTYTVECLANKCAVEDLVPPNKENLDKYQLSRQQGSEPEGKETPNDEDEVSLTTVHLFVR